MGHTVQMEMQEITIKMLEKVFRPGHRSEYNIKIDFKGKRSEDMSCSDVEDRSSGELL
jgi:hypothetical protein